MLETILGDDWMCFYPVYRCSIVRPLVPGNTNYTLVAVVHVHVSVEPGGTWESAGMLQPYKKVIHFLSRIKP